MIRNRTDFVMGVGFVYHDEAGKRRVFDSKQEVEKYKLEAIEDKKKEKLKEEKRKKEHFKPQIELLHRRGIGI